MNETVITAPESGARVPWHLWTVGIVSLLWNSFGGYDYTMTRLRNVDYLKNAGDPAAMLAYIDAMPLYAQIGWGLGVWGSVLGSVLLLTRSRHAVTAFAVSLAGAVLSFAGQSLGPPAPMNEGMMKYMPVLIIALVLLQLWYAARQSRAGVLR
ncbi:MULTISPECIES: hypothetical protein [Sphingomonas]|uniref:hypothetical protein n=1 Tax=Sphingomonas TaxID=13687 RepID=UPI000DEEAD96|nr:MULTISPECIES: hypothetical protein [Sphingomonas]